MSNLDLITQSEIQTFCDCRVKHHFSYEQLLKPKRVNIAFHLGNVIHKWLELYYLGTPAPLAAINSEALVTAGTLGSEDAEEIRQTLNALEGIAAIYPSVDPVKRYKLEVLKVEYQFQIQDPNVPRRKLTGKIDLLLRDSSKRIWIMDHKSVSRIDQRFANGFRTNRQMQIYLMGARFDPNILSLGKVAGVIPNLIRKPQLRRKVSETTEQEFHARVRADIDARQDEYFFSDMIPFEPAINKDTEEEVWPLIKEIRKPLKERLMYKNPAHCESYLGKCAFHDICHKVPGFESGYTQKTARHEELTVAKSKPQAPQKVVETPSAESSKRTVVAVTEQVGKSEVKVSRLDALVQNIRGKTKQRKIK